MKNVLNKRQILEIIEQHIAGTCNQKYDMWFDFERNKFLFYVKFSHIQHIEFSFDVPDNTRMQYILAKLYIHLQGHPTLLTLPNAMKAAVIIATYDLMNSYEKVVPDNIHPGRELFVVRHSSGTSIIEHLLIESYPHRIGVYNSLFVYVKNLKRPSEITYVSLKDMNVVPNNYNNHAAFFTLDEAQSFIAGINS